MDLSNEKWEAVKVTRDGWQVVLDPPVRFRRPQGMFPLPTPIKNGSLAHLRDMVNVGSDSDWALLLGWLIQALRPTGPYPILVLHGEQGSAKSTVARILRRLVDPNKAELRGDYREARDLAIAATNGWFLVLDNLSHLSTWLSDALCRLSTGGGFGTRMLYANDEEILFDFQRPIILTGIQELVTGGDTLDRAIVVYLPAIPKGNRRPEKAFWEDFTAAQSGFLGALLDAVSVGLSNVNQVTLKELPRMADFAIWCSAAEPGLPLEAGAFMAAYMGNRDSANELTLESSPVVAPLKELLEQGEWCGTATELLAHLDHQVEEKITKGRTWPKTPRSLSNVLRRIAANLRAAGIEIDFYRENLGSKRRMIEIRKSEEKSVTCVTSDTDRFGFPDRGDAIPGDGSELTSPDEARVTQGYMWSDDGVAGDASFPIDSDVLGCTCSDPSDPPIPADGQPDCQGCGHNQFVCPTCRGCRLCG